MLQEMIVTGAAAAPVERAMLSATSAVAAQTA